MATQKVKDKLTSLIHMADIFNEPVYLNMKGSRKLSSSLGGFLSAALIIFLLSQGVMQSVSMFQMEDPEIYQINELEDDPTPVYINQTNNFHLALQISKYSMPINMSQESPFSFQLTFNQYIRDSEGNRLKIKNKVYMAPCNKSNFPEDIYGKGMYERHNLAYAYCPTTMNMTYPNNNTCPDWVVEQYPDTDCMTPLSYTIRGAYLSLAFEFIQLNLQACTASQSKTNFNFKCTTENIPNLLSSGEYKVQLFYANNVINPTYYKIPNMTYLETLYWEINPQLSKTADIFLDKEIVQDYDSLWSSTDHKNQTHYSIQPSGMRELNVLQTSTGTTYLQWNIRRSSVSVVTTRTYSKIQDIMTDLGGFAQAVMFVAAFIAMGYVEYKYEMTLSNEFYDFQFTDEPNEPPKKKDHSKRKQDYLDEGIESPKINVNEEDKPHAKASKQSMEKVVEEYREKKQSRKEIEFNLWEYVKKLFRTITCSKNQKDEIAETAKELVEDELDIIRVIQKLKEIDKLKVLLLNRYQREVFNFIEKPLVTLENENPIHLDNVLPDLSFELEETQDEDESQPNQGFLNGREEFNSLSKYGKLYMAYRYLVEDSLHGNQDYNKKLLDMIGEDLIKVFQRVDLLIEDNPDPRNFEEIIKQVFDYPEAFGE